MNAINAMALVHPAVALAQLTVHPALTQTISTLMVHAKLPVPKATIQIQILMSAINVMALAKPAVVLVNPNALYALMIATQILAVAQVQIVILIAIPAVALAHLTVHPALA